MIVATTSGCLAAKSPLTRTNEFRRNQADPFGRAIARRFASLDHISGGRAGWNIVTTSKPDAALNFGREDHLDHDERYRRARIL